MLVGPVHGHEVEGLTGLINLISVMETGRDLSGAPREQLRLLANACRLIILPVANPDGLARFAPRALHGMERVDVRWWGQGAWSDGSLCGWPDCKRVHPMPPEGAGFLGCYFNDAGVNPAHDEFFAPMGPEAPAVLNLARREAPNFAALLHSHESPPSFLRPAYVPLDVQEQVRRLAAHTWTLYDAAGLAHGGLFDPSAESGPHPAALNLTSAVYHVSGAVPFTFECTHGLRDMEQPGPVGFRDLLEMQMLLYTGLFQHASEVKEASMSNER